jgi:hypothetical protein
VPSMPAAPASLLDDTSDIRAAAAAAFQATGESDVEDDVVVVAPPVRPDVGLTAAGPVGYQAIAEQLKKQHDECTELSTIMVHLGDATRCQQFKKIASSFKQDLEALRALVTAGRPPPQCQTKAIKVPMEK